MAAFSSAEVLPVNRKPVEVPLDRLSQTDREFIADMEKAFLKKPHIERSAGNLRPGSTLSSSHFLQFHMTDESPCSPPSRRIRNRCPMLKENKLSKTH
jgi:hypothetical protein